MDLRISIMALSLILIQSISSIAALSSSVSSATFSSSALSTGQFSTTVSQTSTSEHCAFNPCYNGGTCHPSAGYFFCECPQAFDGVVCEQRATTTTTTTITTTTTTQNPLPHECPFNACRNGGFCVQTLDRYECFCPPGITGILCGDVNVSSSSVAASPCPFNPCSNGGYCVSAGQNFKCYCPLTHTGKFCDSPVSIPSTTPLTTSPHTQVSTTTTPPQLQGCNVDLQFLLDSSGSIGRRNFATMLSFTQNLVSNLDSHHHDARVGVAVYSSIVYPSFYLNTHSTVNNIVSAIGRIPYHNGNSDTENALEFVREHAFTATRGDRDNVPNVLIIIADGQSSHPRLAIAEAEKLKNAGVKIIAVGVGNSFDRNELDLIATDSSHVFTVSDYDALKNVENDLLLMTCLNA